MLQISTDRSRRTDSFEMKFETISAIFANAFIYKNNCVVRLIDKELYESLIYVNIYKNL